MNVYEDLANAIILQAVQDYRRTNNKRALEDLERFFLSDWFSVLTSIDGSRLLQELRKEKRVA